MDHNAFLVWWLLAVPVVLAIVDRMMMGGSTSAGPGGAIGYHANHEGRAGTSAMPPVSRAP